MENKGTGGKVAIVGAIITALAGIITTIVSISAPLIDKRMDIQTTQTKEAAVLGAARVAGVAIEKVDTPTPRDLSSDMGTPAQDSVATRIAAPTYLITLMNTAAQGASQPGNEAPQASSTPPAAFLKVGETKTSSGGIAVQLTKIEFPAPNEVHLHFTFTNRSPKVMNISLIHNQDVILTDDTGGYYSWATAFTWAVSIYPGTSRNDEVKRRGDVSQASYFIVKLEIPGIISAQWRN